MKKVAIVGVEGSGKTVMLAGLGDLYTYPDEDGYFLAPKNFGTAAYVAERIARMRKGEWPKSTVGDEMQGLDWTLKRQKPGEKGRPDTSCEVSFLDFGGEVYRAAYGISGDGDAMHKEQVEELKQYVRGADDLIVLINLCDVITNGIRDMRVQESMWITKSILDTALGGGSGKNRPRAAIVLSQADSYASTIEACGGAAGVLRKYLPHVANDYDWLDIFAVNAVDRTELDDDGNMVPTADFTAKGLKPIVTWVLDGIDMGAADGDIPESAYGNLGGTVAVANDFGGTSANMQAALDDSGNMVPAADFTTEGLRPITNWPLQGDVRQPKKDVRQPKKGVRQPRNSTLPAAGRARSGILKHFTFQGRKNRAQYWSTIGCLYAIGSIIFGIIMVIAPCLDSWHKSKPVFDNIDKIVMAGAFFVIILFPFCVTCAFVTNIVHRLHDFNRSGKWGLLCLIPYVVFLLPILIGIIPGTNGDNDYGPRP